MTLKGQIKVTQLSTASILDMVRYMVTIGYIYLTSMVILGLTYDELKRSKQGNMTFKALWLLYIGTLIMRTVLWRYPLDLN